MSKVLCSFMPLCVLICNCPIPTGINGICHSSAGVEMLCWALVGELNCAMIDVGNVMCGLPFMGKKKKKKR